MSDCRKLNSRVRESALRPLLFLLSINDLPDEITSTCKCRFAFP